MSFPSISAVLEERGLNVDTAPENDLENALWEAFNRDLPLGVAFVTNLADQVRHKGRKLIINEDPNSPCGKQVMRLLGTDVARKVCRDQMRQRTGIPTLALCLYNCCGGGGAPTEEELKPDPRTQIKLQNGTLAPAHC